MTAIQPFPDATNQTGIYFATKVESQNNFGSSTIPCRIWKPLKSPRIDPGLTLTSVLEQVSLEDGEALPIGDLGTPYWTGNKNHYDSVVFLRGNSSFLSKTHRGTVNDLARVYWVKVEKYSPETNHAFIRTLTEEELPGAKTIDPVNGAWIEADLLFPLLRGREVGRYSIDMQGWYQIIPNRHYRVYEDETEFAVKYPAAYSYFRNFSNLLPRRATFKKFTNYLPSYGIFCVGDYSFSEYKVVWPEQQNPSNFHASVVTKTTDTPIVPNQVIVPDHKLYFTSVDTLEEAHYLCAILNSRPVRLWLGGFLLSKQIGTSIFSYTRVPPFETKNIIHQRISSISLTAHNARLKNKSDDFLAPDLENELEDLVKKNCQYL